MKRIAIIGSGGAGKSVLAKRLGDSLDAPIYHLDKLFWKPGWVEPDKEEWAELQRGLCQNDLWIMDGNYGGTMEIRLAACDTVIFMDLPRMLCIYRALARTWKYRNRTRPDVAEGCPERVSWEFICYIWSYPRTRRPKILERLKEFETQKRVVVLSSKKAVRAFLGTL